MEEQTCANWPETGTNNTSCRRQLYLTWFLRDFIDSVLYRFALMKLPLRPGWSRSISLFVWQACYLPEDIAVSEESEVRRVVRESLSLIAKETGALLRWETTLIIQMKSESSPRGETLRSSGFHLASLSKARSQLQGLLNILQAWAGLESDLHSSPISCIVPIYNQMCHT